MATPSPHPHTIRGAVYLQTGDVAPKTEVFLEHTIPGRTIMVQAAYFDREKREDDTLSYILPAEITPEKAGIAAIGGRVQLAPISTTPGSTNISILETTEPFASTSQTTPGAAADDKTGTIWYNNTSESPDGAHWGIKCDPGETVQSVQIEWHSAAYTANFDVQTSPDGSTWTTAQSFVGVGGGTQDAVLTSAVTSHYFRLLFNTPVNSTYVVAREIRFQRADGSGYPLGPHYATTAASLNSTLWDDGIEFAVRDLQEPGKSTVRFIVSVDGRSSWQYWNGSAWAAAALTSASWGAICNDAGVLRALTPANWAALIGAGGTFDVAIQMETSDPTYTPAVSGLVITYATGMFRKVASSSEVELREYDDGATVGVRNIGSVTRDFFVSILAIPQP